MFDLDKVPLLDGKIEVLSGFAFPSSGFNQLDGLPLIRIRDLSTNTTEVRFRGVYDPAYRVSKGDLLIGMDGDFEVYRWGGEDALLNQRVCKISSASREVDQGFLYWYLKPKITEIHRRTPQTTVRHLSTKDIYAIAEPPVSFLAQEHIAQILDTLETAVCETEALIDKLKAVKQGLLHDLLTRGIDANGQLRLAQSEAPQLYKMSSVGWIPREWEVLPLGCCADIASGITLGRALNSPVAIELPYLRVANVQDGYLALGEIKTVSILPSELNRFALKVGDVLMNEGGDFDKLGRGAVWEGQIEPCLHQNHVFRVRCDNSKLLPAFLAAYSSSARGKTYFVQASKQTTNLASINSTQLKAFGISCPSVAEQLFITQRLSTFDKKMAVEQEALEKLRQQKIGLMDDLLTGRVCVTPLLKSTQQAAAQTEA